MYNMVRESENDSISLHVKPAAQGNSHHDMWHSPQLETSEQQMDTSD